MKKKENITGGNNKKIMYRSPPPPVRVFKKKVIQTKEEAAFLMYLGAEFDLNEDQVGEASEGKRLASQGSIRSLSVPPPSSGVWRPIIFGKFLLQKCLWIIYLKFHLKI